MSKTQQTYETDFGLFLAKHGITHGVAADALGVTRAYVGMLANGKASPILHFAYTIKEWSKRIDPKHPVSMESWVDSARGAA